MRKYLAAIILLVICNSSIGQQKMLSMEDAILNARTTLAPENLKQLQFIKGTNDYVYMKKADGRDFWVKGNFTSKVETTFLTLAQLNSRLRAAGIDTVAVLPSIQFNTDKWVLTLKGQKYFFNTKDSLYKIMISKSIGEKDNVEQSSDDYTAYLDDFNLYVTKNGDTKQVTTDGSKDIVYASSVHRDEFGISKGTFWSNDGKQLAFYRMDQSMVTDYPIIDWTSNPAHTENIKYPMAGGKSHHVTVGIYNAVTKNTIWVKTGEPAEQYLTNIAWSPDNRFVFIAVLNRGQDHMWLNQYDAATGNFVKTLFEETDTKYVEPLVPMLFVKNKPDQFIWQSKKDGWNHLYLYNINGTPVKQLTSGQWEVIDVRGFDSKGENLFYTSTQQSPISKNLYLLDLKKNITKAITTTDCLHNVQVSSDGSFVIDNFSTTTNPRTIQVIETKTGKAKTLLQAAVCPEHRCLTNNDDAGFKMIGL